MRPRLNSASLPILALCLAAVPAVGQDSKQMTEAERQARIDAAMKAMAKAKAEATFHIGDPAPPMKVVWIKGKASTNLQDGKVHVIEFWATWCGPCRRDMPDLSELAEKYRGQVDIVSVSIWPRAHTADKNAPYSGQVIDFVKHAGNMMDYPVAMDTPDEYMANTWMKASGSAGIPMAFVIDKHGRYAWGNPGFAGLGEAIEYALQGKLDAAAVTAIHDRYQAGMKLRGKLLDEADADLKEGKADEALKAAEGAARAVPVFANSSWLPEYQAHALKSKQEAQTFLDDVLSQHGNAPIDLMEFASGIMEDDPAGAVKLLQGALRCSRPTDPSFTMELAKAFAKAGDYKSAAKEQEQAIVGLQDPTIDEFKEMIAPQKKVLEEYREKAKAQSR